MLNVPILASHTDNLKVCRHSCASFFAAQKNLNLEKDFKITPENFAEFIKMIYKDEISSKTAKQVLAEMFKTGGDPSDIVKDNDLGQISDGGAIDKIIEDGDSEEEVSVENELFKIIEKEY